MTILAPTTDSPAAPDFYSLCGNRRCHAGHPPAQWVVGLACGCVDLICGPCKHELETATDVFGNHPAAIQCLECGHSRVGVVTDFVVRTERI